MQLVRLFLRGTSSAFQEDGIGNLEDLRRLVLIDEKCGDLKVVVDCGERTRNISQQTFRKPTDAHSETHTIGESVCSVSMWNIVNHLGKHDFACG